MIYQYFKSNFWDFLKEELDFTLKMIKKSFSNFSAWHYRSKLITLDLANKNIPWSSEEVLDYLKEDLFYIKNAIFTDPRDQSAWNYYYWILTNLTPIYIKSTNVENYLLKIKLSQKIPIVEFLELKISNVNNEFDNNYLKDFLSKNSNANDLSIQDNYHDEIILDFSKIFNSNSENLEEHLKNLQINDSTVYKLNLNLKAKDVSIKDLLFTDNNLNFSNNICPLKNNLDFPVMTFSLCIEELKDIEIYYPSKLNSDKYHHLKSFLKNQLNMINELIVNTDGFVENAHYRKTQIMMLINDLKFDNFSDQINSELNLLIDKSKRNKEVYRKLIETF